MAVKVSLTERISIEAGEVVVDEQRFPGRQGRLVFAYLLSARGRPVPKDDLAAALWGDEPPAKWDKALSVLVSKLRTLLNECGIDGASALTSAFGCYQLTLPADSWIDATAADEAASAAESALAGDDLNDAVDNASTAAALARRTFLPGEDGQWVDEQRRELRATLVRALECLAEATRLVGDPAASVRTADELVALEPYRERGYRLLMQAQSAAGNDAEALRTYDRCRTLLAEELGAFPSPETEAIYLEILRGDGSAPTTAEAAVTAQHVRREPPGSDSATPNPGRRRRVVLLAVLVAGLAAGAAVAGVLLRSDDSPAPITPTSVVRIDPDTLDVERVATIGPRADLVVAAGGYVWITHGLFRYVGSDDLRNAGDRILTRVDPSSGESKVVGGGLAPCGLAADPSGDVWVANCYAAGPNASVVRVDADTLEFEKTYSVPAGTGYFRGVAYGGGSLWLAQVSGGGAVPDEVTEVDPRTGTQRSIPLDRHPGWLAWSEGYGDLWMNDFSAGSISRLHPATGQVRDYESLLLNPATIVVAGDTVWAGDWNGPNVVRIPALGSRPPHRLTLPSAGGVTTMAAGAGYVWATVPDNRAVWRIDPKSNEVTRIAVPYYPWGVAVDDNGVWVALRASIAS